MLVDKMRENLILARKKQNKVEESVFGNIVAKILNAEKSGKYQLPLDDNIVESIVQKEAKELEETLSYYREKSCPQAIFLNNQLMVLKAYIPEQFTEKEVIEIIKRFAETENNKGKLIGLVCKEVGNNFDRSKVAGLVNKIM